MEQDKDRILQKSYMIHDCNKGIVLVILHGKMLLNFNMLD
jgi:hypothetical protein